MAMNASTENDSLLKWGQKQSHILTGGGIIESHSKPGVDFTEAHLPHYVLKSKTTRQTIRKWLDQNIRSKSIVGAWGRPLFSGGWMESTDGDTESFNLQTPSIFIDMRIPVSRPTLRLRMRQSLSECSDYELRLLSRQHCFSGYSYLEDSPENAPIFTRHHIIDWNYHPAYPRSRPNRWWVETKPVANSSKDGSAGGATESFKEFSVIRDQYNVPVYMERWARREPQQHQPTKYLAIRKVRTCPAILKAEGKPPQKDCVLVIVGQHWCLAIDRDYTSLDAHMQHIEELKQKGDYSPPAAVGGGPVFVDNLLDTSDKQGDYALRRRAAEDYLSLEGSYGVLSDNLSSTQSTVFSSATAGNSGAAGVSSHFVVQRSTQPWLEGSALPFQDIVLHFDKDTGVLKGIFCGPPTATAGTIAQQQGRLAGEWEVLENSFEPHELQAMFKALNGQHGQGQQQRLRAKL